MKVVTKYFIQRYFFKLSKKKFLLSRLYESIVESNVFGVLSNISFEDFNRDEFSQTARQLDSWTARRFPVHFWFFIGYRYSLTDTVLQIQSYRYSLIQIQSFRFFFSKYAEQPLKLIVVTVWKSTRRNFTPS